MSQRLRYTQTLLSLLLNAINRRVRNQNQKNQKTGFHRSPLLIPLPNISFYKGLNAIMARICGLQLSQILRSGLGLTVKKLFLLYINDQACNVLKFCYCGGSWESYKFGNKKY